MSLATRWWRHLLLVAYVAGILASSLADVPRGWLAASAVIAAVALVGRGRLRLGAGIIATLVIGLGVGDARQLALEPGPIGAEAGDRVELSGFVATSPRRSDGEVRVPIELERGRVLAVIAEPIGEMPIGSRWLLHGRLGEPEEWRAEQVRRLGAALELKVRSAERVAGQRQGIVGSLDRIRARAEAALVAGTTPERAALLRGFVLGQDDLIEPGTREQFERSGLSHLLAVSGQNVMLLAILVGAILMAVGTDLRTRLLVTLLVIAVYVPVAGAGPSIQRAGIMGAAAIIALLLSRPADRVYIPLLAAAGTLTLDPRFAVDVGWQLSFVAVIGISLWAARIRELIEPALEAGGPLTGALGRPVAEGLALTIAATIATAPLLAHHFERISLVTLPANLLVLPAVAPAMWLGMAASLVGQLPLVPAEPLSWLAGWCAAYIAKVAALTAGPEWAVADVSLHSIVAIGLIYACCAAGMALLLPAAARRSGLARLGVIAGGPAVAVVVAGVTALLFSGSAGELGPLPPETMRVVAYDIGQGDATLVEAAGSSPILVDGGPPDGEIVRQLRSDGITRLAAVIGTHDQLDHIGALAAVIEQLDVDRLLLGRPAPQLEAVARARGVAVEHIGAPQRLRSGPLKLDVIGPQLADAPADDPNDDSVVLVASLGSHRVLLSGDAESSVIPDPGPLDLLKVAHHGSADPGVDSLLDRSLPQLAFVSVGADNRYGHPTPETLGAFATRGICVLRTDLDGKITIGMGPNGVTTSVEEEDVVAQRPGCEGLG